MGLLPDGAESNGLHEVKSGAPIPSQSESELQCAPRISGSSWEDLRWLSEHRRRNSTPLFLKDQGYSAAAASRFFGQVYVAASLGGRVDPPRMSQKFRGAHCNSDSDCDGIGGAAFYFVQTITFRSVRQKSHFGGT